MKFAKHLLSALLLCLLPARVQAHELEAARITLQQTGETDYLIEYDVPPGKLLDYPPPILPDRCRWAAPPNAVGGNVRLAFRTGARPLAMDDRIVLNWNRSGVLASVFWKSGAAARQYFPNSGTETAIPLSELRAGSGSAGRAARRYTALGTQHILKGIDHLFFIAGLLMLVRSARALLFTITAFTLAHSITLALSVFGLLRISSAMADVMVALSIVLLAGEIIRGRRGQTTLAHRKPWLMSFCFGLVHGLGFAGALEALGLPNESIPLALLFFNIGVELGQLLFTAVWLTARHAFRVLDFQLNRWWNQIAVYALGTTASLWLFVRLGSSFTN